MMKQIPDAAAPPTKSPADTDPSGILFPGSGLSPRNDLSGSKVLNRKTRKVVSRLATALRMAATTLRQSDSYLGAQFRRFRTRLGAPKAITAMASKLARLIYRMLHYGQEYVDRGTAHYEHRHRQQQIQFLARKAAQQGFALVKAGNLHQTDLFQSSDSRGVSGECERGT